MKRKSIVLIVVACAVIAGGSRAILGSMPTVEKRVTAVQGAGYFPVLIRLNSGRLLVVYRYGAPHISVKGQLAVSWSDNDGKSWSAPLAVTSGQNDHRNPSMAQLPDGEILLTYCIMDGYDATGRKFRPSVNGKDPRTARPLWIIRSRDQGATWSSPEEIAGMRPLADRGELLNSFGKMAVTQDGTVLLSVYATWKDHHSSSETIFRSTDKGHTWKLLSTVADGVNETALLALPDNHVIAALRTNKEQKLEIAHSSDAGKTWDTPVDVTQPNEHPGDLIRLQNGDILLTFGERNAPRGARAILSHDGGNTWGAKSRMVLADDAPLFDCGYPSSVQLPDGRIVTVYYKVQNAATAPESTSLEAITWRLPTRSAP